MNTVRATHIAGHSYNCSCLFLSGKIGRRHLLSPILSTTVHEEIKGRPLGLENVDNFISFMLDEYLAIRPSYLGVYIPLRF